MKRESTYMKKKTQLDNKLDLDLKRLCKIKKSTYARGSAPLPPRISKANYISYFLKTYSVLIASNALNFIARLAGKYPEINPTKNENANANSESQIGITLFVVAPEPVMSKLK